MNIYHMQVGQAGFAGGNSADAANDVGAAFIMGTGRTAARKAAARSAKEQAHEAAIFGGGAAAGADVRQQQQAVWDRPEPQQQQKQKDVDDVAGGEVEGGEHDAAAALGLNEGLLVQQKGLSWRERALAKRQQ